VEASSTARRAARRAVLTLAAARSINAGMLIYKIFRADEWAQLKSEGETRGAPIDLADGYVHFSTAETVAETAALHFADQDGLFLLAVDAETLGDDLKWEASRGGILFPHLFRVLRLSDVLWAQPLRLQDGAHQFPAGFEGAGV